jgi:hypothetical protein
MRETSFSALAAAGFATRARGAAILRGLGAVVSALLAMMHAPFVFVAVHNNAAVQQSQLSLCAAQ